MKAFLAMLMKVGFGPIDISGSGIRGGVGMALVVTAGLT
jgi:hypothetical protein